MSTPPINTSTTMNTGAAESLSKTGHAIKKGRERERMALGDNRLMIAAKSNITFNKTISGIFKQIFLNLRYVKLNDANPIYVNVNSLAARLHLSKSEIKEAAKEGTLEELIQKKAVLQIKILDNYSKIFDQYETHAAFKQETQLDKKILMKAVRTAVPLLWDQEKPQTSATFNAKKLFVAKKEDSDDLTLTFKTKQILGKGTFAVVSGAMTLNAGAEKTKERQVFKMATNSRTAQQTLEKEDRMLDHLTQENGGKPPPNIMPASSKCMKITDPDSGEEVAIGSLRKAMDGSFEDCLKLPIEERLKLGADFLNGLVFLAEKKVVHKDLKPNNILFEEVNDKKTAYICDFGDAIKLDDKTGSYEEDSSIKGKKEKIFNWGDFTPRYTSPYHVAIARDCWENGEYVQSNQLFLENDVFAAGVVLYELLSGGSYPCTLNELGFPHPPLGNFSESLLIEQGVPRETIVLIKEMLLVALSAKPPEEGEPPPDKAITIQEVQQRYNRGINLTHEVS